MHHASDKGSYSMASCTRHSNRRCPIPSMTVPPRRGDFSKKKIFRKYKIRLPRVGVRTYTMATIAIDAKPVYQSRAPESGFMAKKKKNFFFPMIGSCHAPRLGVGVLIRTPTCTLVPQPLKPSLPPIECFLIVLVL